jgi:hypothetical protein
MLCHGLNRGFTQFGISLFNIHDQWTPPPVPIKFIPGLFEGPAFMGWPGPIQTTHKFGAHTFFDGHEAIQQSHDVGYLIPHLALPMNAMCGVHMLISKHKIMMPISSVEIENKMMGVYLGIFLGQICSNPVSLPLGAGVLLGGTVITEATPMDVLLGLSFIMVEMLFDAFWSLVAKGDVWGRPWRNADGKVLTDAAGKKLYKAVYGKFPRPLTFYKGHLQRLIQQTDTLPDVLVQKVSDHLYKSWVFGPLVKGGVFQSLASVPGGAGVDRTRLPSVSLGRGMRFKVNFFPWGSGGNTSN